MKRLITILLLSGAACSPKLHHENDRKPISFSDKQLDNVYDSLTGIHKNYRQIIGDFEEGLLSRTDNTSYPREVIILASGKIIAYATTNNRKVSETVSRFPGISPVELILELRGIDGEIKFQRELLTEDWIGREHFPGLLGLAEVDVRMPMITLLTGPPYGSDCIMKECLLKTSFARTNITIGFEALHMMKLYLNVGGGYPSDLRNDLTLMNDWFYSNKPREDYRKMLNEKMKSKNAIY